MKEFYVEERCAFVLNLFGLPGSNVNASLVSPLGDQTLKELNFENYNPAQSSNILSRMLKVNKDPTQIVTFPNS